MRAVGFIGLKNTLGESLSHDFKLARGARTRAKRGRGKVSEDCEVLCQRRREREEVIQERDPPPEGEREGRGTRACTKETSLKYWRGQISPFSLFTPFQGAPLSLPRSLPPPLVPKEVSALLQLVGTNGFSSSSLTISCLFRPRYSDKYWNTRARKSTSTNVNVFWQLRFLEATGIFQYCRTHSPVTNEEAIV